MELRFVKLHGIGNDFVLFDLRGEQAAQAGRLERAAARLCDRRRGIGADGLLLLGAASGAAARLTIFNSDGSRPEMCGNGLRCAALYLAAEAAAGAGPLVVATDAGPRSCWVERGAGAGAATVRVEMGRPSLAVRDAGFRWSEERFVAGDLGEIAPGLQGTVVSVGNPHLVVFDPPQASLGEAALSLGPRLERWPRFGAGANVEFARREAPGLLSVAVWERGCGITQACGTGASAVAVAACATGRAAPGEPLRVALPGGELRLTVGPGLASLLMEGPAERVYAGAVEV